jgi:hypothetical protein
VKRLLAGLVVLLKEKTAAYCNVTMIDIRIVFVLDGRLGVIAWPHKSPGGQKPVGLP